MNFVSLEFLIFVAVVCILYYAIPKKYRWIVLLISSYVFYALCDVRFIFFIVITSLTIYGSARLLAYSNSTYNTIIEGKNEEWLKQNKQIWQKKIKRQKRWILTIALLINFGILLSIKYINLIAGIINPIINVFDMSPISTAVLVPLGISYYTFQSIGYLIDVFYNKVKAEKNVFKFALFTSFFPQLVQGPISRFDQLAPQLYEGNKFNWQTFKNGILLVAWGMFKMLCISVFAGAFYQEVAAISSGWWLTLALFAGMIYVYTSFSGGIDIARGVAQMLGIDMVENFKRPYFATSMNDFWRRWHISLSTWFRDYVYFPIAFSKTYNKFSKKVYKRMPNQFGKFLPAFLITLFVFTLLGIWHGGSEKYLVYGLYMGILVAISVFTDGPARNFEMKHPKMSSKKLYIKIPLILFTLLLTFFSRIILLSDGFASMADILSRMFSATDSGNFLKTTSLTVFNAIACGISCLILFTVSVMQESGIKIREGIAKRNFVARAFIYTAFALVIILFAVWGKEVVFIYGRH